MQVSQWVATQVSQQPEGLAVMQRLVSLERWDLSWWQVVVRFWLQVVAGFWLQVAGQWVVFWWEFCETWLYQLEYNHRERMGLLNSLPGAAKTIREN